MNHERDAPTRADILGKMTHVTLWLFFCMMPRSMILQTSDYEAEEVKPQCPYVGRNYCRICSQWSHVKMARSKYRKRYIIHAGKNPWVLRSARVTVTIGEAERLVTLTRGFLGLWGRS